MIKCSPVHIEFTDTGENLLPFQNDLDIDSDPKPTNRKRRSPVKANDKSKKFKLYGPPTNNLNQKRKGEKNNNTRRQLNLNTCITITSPEDKENICANATNGECDAANRINQYSKVSTGQRVNTISTAGTYHRPAKEPQQPRQLLPRRCKANVSYANSEMSTLDQYNYQSPDTTSGGGVHRIGRNMHASDNYHTNSDNRQQLQDIATKMASLCNIGNSCYMNSVLYTLRFAPFFLHNLHHLVDDISQIINNRKENQAKVKSSSLGRNISGLQGQNARSWSSKDLASLGSAGGQPIEIPKTIQQIATDKLHDLFVNLHRNESMETLEPYQSDNFLKAIQDVNPIFEGNQQQDAHEFLMCILDSIRETCQSLTKVILDHPEVIMNG